MKRVAICIFIFTVISKGAFALSWQDLWQTKNQQGQQLMSQGQYKEAEETFKRNDWKATAAYRAGNYDTASDLYRQMNRENAFYNQGNALAHMGRYEEAIKAYDKALSINPDNQDALYNRKLLKDLMKKDKEKQQKQKNKDQDKQDQDKQDQDKQDQDKQDQDKQDQDKQDQDKQDQDKQDQDKQDQDKQDQDKQDQDKQDQDKQDQDKQDQDKQDQDKQDQDKQDQDKQNQDKRNQDKQDQTRMMDEKQAAQSKADREHQQAKQQWLKLVPDDPGGLLREKFLRDHLRRQRGWY